MELILVRHTTVAVKKGTCYGQTDVDLSDTFEKEAFQVQLNLLKQMNEVNIPVFSSPLSRCVRLAAYCKYPDAVQDDRLMEMNMGKWEMCDFSNISDPQLEKWYANWIEEAPTSGESFLQMLERTSAFFQELKNEGYKQVLIFTHGGVIECARILTGERDLKQAFKNPVQYGEIISLQY